MYSVMFACKSAQLCIWEDCNHQLIYALLELFMCDMLS